MGKFDGVLLVSDFDDTLYGSDLTVSGENVKAVRYFIEQGGCFTVATGRARPAFAPPGAVPHQRAGHFVQRFGSV